MEIRKAGILSLLSSLYDVCIEKNTVMDSTLSTFRKVALLEGISYIVLLGIAMPLKYFLDSPSAVRIVGWAHGVLFMTYVLLLLLCWAKYKWAFTRVAFYFVASLLPFVPFYVERSLRKN